MPNEPLAWWVTWLRCAGPCNAMTPHALVDDAPNDEASHDWREDDNRRVDGAHRILHRRLAGLESEGVEIAWACAEEANGPAQSVGNFDVLLTEGRPRYVLTLRAGTHAADLLVAIEQAEWLLDNLSEADEDGGRTWPLHGRQHRSQP